MARLRVSLQARENLESLIATHSLPSTTRSRVRDCLRPLRPFPRMGVALEGEFEGYRFLLGPWDWMLLIYRYYEARDESVLVAIQDARRASSPTTGR